MSMLDNHAVEMFTLLCALAGALHVLAPDHWVPASILSWQKGWKASRVALFSILVFVSHLLLGFLIFFLARPLMEGISSSTLLAFSLTLVALVAIARGMRFSRIREVLRGGQGGIWGVFTVFSLLGPCESIIPVFIKAGHLGTGYLLPFSAFFAGTLVAGIALIFSGRMIWNRPQLLPRALNWSRLRVAVIPVVTGVVVGLTYILKLG